eukprot:CCRYP_014348-RA/>CCRYP_014348-RA protein AED:0.25 eAED:0.25 QI:0/-1/0/1/-1/1/1/0/1158
MNLLLRIISLLCKSATLSLRIMMFLLLGTVKSAFISPMQRSPQPQDYFPVSRCVSRVDTATQVSVDQRLSLLRKKPMVTALHGSLRDILNDGPASTSRSDLNSHIDTVEMRQKLTNQLQTISTQEIRRELEQTYNISTASLRGKDQLITALVMARLTGSLSVSPTDGGVNPNFRDQYVEPGRGASTGANPPLVNNANYEKDIDLMGVGEIKRELQLYGVVTDAYADRRELLALLIQERHLRNLPTPSKRPKIEVNVVPTSSASSNRTPSPESLSDEGGNESIRSPSRMAELTKVTVLSKNQKEAKQPQSSARKMPIPSNENFIGENSFPVPPYSTASPRTEQQDAYSQQTSLPFENPFFVDDTFSPNDFAQQDETYDGAKLRDLQIAFEFDRVQSTLSSAADIQTELASKFNIDTKYFLGLKEMAYALAVARVDDAIERQQRRRNGKDDDGCVVRSVEASAPISKNKNVNFDGLISSNFNNSGKSTQSECVDEVDGILPSRDELISMEFQRLQPLDEYELSWELEIQYGIPSKHFLGKKELAYALAVERVDTAQKEADAARDNKSDPKSDPAPEPGKFAWMSDEEMMRMMEEEMMKAEVTEEMLTAEQQHYPQELDGTPENTVSTVPSQNQSRPSSKSSRPTSLKDMIRINTKKDSARSRQPVQSSNGNFQYQGETLHERERRKENETKRKSPATQQPQMGTVIGGEREDKTSVSREKSPAAQRDTKETKPNAQSPSLSDVLKSSSRQQTTRVRATAPPPRPPQQQRPPRSASKASSPFDVSFGVGAWRTSGGIGNTASSNVYQSDYSMPRRSPFEVPPFPDPSTYSNPRGPPPPPFGPFSSNQVYTETRTSFEPGAFTPPRKHNVDSIPPPPRGRRNTNPRNFNIRDTEGPRPFVGSQTVYDQSMPPSPPLQVEPPPRDENNPPPPQRPFEPAPFSRPQPHTVYNDRPPRDRSGSAWKTSAPPPPRNQWNTSSQSQQKRDGTFPFDRMKDIFDNMRSGSNENTDKFEAQVKFKDDKVEVMNDDWTPFYSKAQRQNPKSKTADVRIVDAELDAGSTNQYQGFATAWKGGPQSNQSQGQVNIPDPTNSYNTQITPPEAMKKAYELLANPEVRAIATQAKSNPKVREAVQACAVDPTKFGEYLDDPEIGPILQELKKCIL